MRIYIVLFVIYMVIEADTACYHVFLFPQSMATYKLIL